MAQLKQEPEYLPSSLYLYFDGDLQSCHNSLTHKEHLVWCLQTCIFKRTVTQCSTFNVSFTTVSLPDDTCARLPISLSKTVLVSLTCCFHISSAFTFRLRALSGTVFPVLPTSVTLASFALCSVRGSSFCVCTIPSTIWVSSELFFSASVHDNLRCCCSAWFSLSLPQGHYSLLRCCRILFQLSRQFFRTVQYYLSLHLSICRGTSGL